VTMGSQEGIHVLKPMPHISVMAFIYFGNLCRMVPVSGFRHGGSEECSGP
jgi:hypothetical protein